MGCQERLAQKGWSKRARKTVAIGTAGSACYQLDIAEKGSLGPVAVLPPVSRSRYSRYALHPQSHLHSPAAGAVRMAAAAMTCPRNDCKIFVGGLSWTTDASRLRSYFSNWGEVSDAFVSYDRDTGRPRGFGFVVFSDPRVADRVISLQHTVDRREVGPPKTLHLPQQHP